APKHGLLSKALQQLALSVQIAGEAVLALLYRAEERGAREGLNLSLCVKAAGGGLAGRLAIPNLRRRGQVEQTAARVLRLTPAGRARAGSLVRSHRLWELYLVQNFDLPLDHLHEPAQRVQHF